MPRYKPATKADAMARMWVTASKGEDGEWWPNLHAVAAGMASDDRSVDGSQSPGRTTLRRWWKDRDRTQDGRFQTIQDTKRTEMAESGATKQVVGMLGVLEQRMQDCLDDAAAWEDSELTLPQRTQAIINMGRAVALIRPLLGAVAEKEQADGPSKAVRFAERCRRTEG